MGVAAAPRFRRMCCPVGGKPALGDGGPALWDCPVVNAAAGSWEPVEKPPSLILGPPAPEAQDLYSIAISKPGELRRSGIASRRA